MRDKNMLWYFVLIVASIVSASGVLSFFWVPLTEGFSWLLRAIAANPVTENLSIIEAGTWALLTLVSIIVLTMVYRTRHRHLTVVTSHFVHEFNDETGATVYCTRRQIFRSNRPGVNSYIISAKPDFGGMIARESVIIKENGERNYSSLKTGSPTAGWEIVHRFQGGLDFSLLFALVPSWLVRFICIETRDEKPVVVRGKKYLRTLDVDYVMSNEYDQTSTPTIQLINPRKIRLHDIWLCVIFNKYPVDADSVRAHVVFERETRRISASSSHLPTRKFVFRVPVLVENRIRLCWAQAQD